jgi:Sel1 repeat
MHPYANLLRAITTMLMLVPIAGAAVGPYNDALGRLDERRVRDCLSTMGPIADQGALDAQFYLGFMKEYGQGVPRNSVEAFKWYRKAADQHRAVAPFNLGIMYANGEGVPHSSFMLSSPSRWNRGESCSPRRKLRMADFGVRLAWGWRA